jgi:hypothetical protein
MRIALTCRMKSADAKALLLAGDVGTDCEAN